MSFIDEVRADRSDLARVLKKHRGIRKIVEDLYPDSAHFIYELLQNAEDANATSAEFSLRNELLEFSHNGRPFDEDDIRGITDIGEGSKEGETDKIGRFGVGFKAVFAYCETPSIWSPSYSFQITDLVLPSEIPARPGLGDCTRFKFPFNNPKKPAPTAHKEVQSGLAELAETTLLFLNNLEAVRWSDRGRTTEIRRVTHSSEHIEIVRQVNGRSAKSAHFLRFLRPATGAERQNVAIAFELEPIAGTEVLEAATSTAIAGQLRIRPASPGRVAVFFPAEKEASGLRFHIHGPFVPELSRASIKETPVNDPLFEQIAELAARSLHRIRDLGLLTTDFLSVLPNPQDELPDRYSVVRDAIVEEMWDEPLTPTQNRGHAPAKHLVQGEAALKALLSEADIEYLIEYDDVAPQWAVAAAQKNSNVDRFLSGLSIRQWNTESFVGMLSARLSTEHRFIPDPPRWASEPDAELISWLSRKQGDWHQAMYALLADYLASAGLRRPRTLHALKKAQIVRLRSGAYSIAEKCFFGGRAEEDEELMPRVDDTVYSSGKSKTQQESAKRLLVELGVREVGETEQIEAILRHRYAGESIQEDAKDLERFVRLVERDAEAARLFEDHYIFEASDGDWIKPTQTYLDLPYVDTGLGEYYEHLGTQQRRFALSERYLHCGIDLGRFTRFARAVGAQVRLEPDRTSIEANAKAAYLYGVGGQRYSSPVNEDYVIPELKDLLNKGNPRLSRLVWVSMNEMAPNCLQARYQRNRTHGSRSADSQLIHDLATARWIPQEDGTFVHPCVASSDLLPEGFAFDPGKAWLKAVRFGERLGEKAADDERKQAALRAIGVQDERTLERWNRFRQFTEEEQERILSENESRGGPELAGDDLKNPSRRSERVQSKAMLAPDRGSELKVRAVAERRDAVRKEADPYLIHEYQTPEGVMLCQAGQHQLPFKLLDGSYYFESVEILTRAETGKHHKQNYLCLCPTHAAMFRYANPKRENLREAIEGMASQELRLTLAGTTVTVFFSKRHKLDLQAVLKADPRPKRGE